MTRGGRGRGSERKTSGRVGSVCKDTHLTHGSAGEEDVDVTGTPSVPGGGNAVDGAEVVLRLVGLGLGRERGTATANTTLMDMAKGRLPGGDDHFGSGSGRVQTQGSERVEVGSATATSTSRLIFLFGGSSKAVHNGSGSLMAGLTWSYNRSGSVKGVVVLREWQCKASCRDVYVVGLFGLFICLRFVAFGGGRVCCLQVV